MKIELWCEFCGKQQEKIEGEPTPKLCGHCGKPLPLELLMGR